MSIPINTLSRILETYLVKIVVSKALSLPLRAIKHCLSILRVWHDIDLEDRLCYIERLGNQHAGVFPDGTVQQIPEPF
jgi:hypothetical protein